MVASAGGPVAETTGKRLVNHVGLVPPCPAALVGKAADQIENPDAFETCCDKATAEKEKLKSTRDACTARTPESERRSPVNLRLHRRAFKCVPNRSIHYLAHNSKRHQWGAPITTSSTPNFPI